MGSVLAEMVWSAGRAVGTMATPTTLPLVPAAGGRWGERAGVAELLKACGCDQLRVLFRSAESGESPGLPFAAPRPCCLLLVPGSSSHASVG